MATTLPRFVYSRSPRDLDLNNGKPWSRMDVADLKQCAISESTLADAASFLCRSQKETREKALQLGFVLGLEGTKLVFRRPPGDAAG